jgi:MFS family permease
MKNILKLTFAPIISLMAVMMGISYFNTYISLKMHADGFQTIITGILYASFYTGMVLGGFYLEKVIYKFGHIRSFAIFAALTSSVIAIQSLVPPGILWILFRFISGVCCGGIFIVIESWLLLLSNKDNRGIILSFYMVGLYLSQCIGQFGIITVPIASNLSFNLSLIFCTLSILPVCMMKTTPLSQIITEHVSVFYILKNIPLSFMGNLTSGFILGSFYALGPIYAKNLDFSYLQTSLAIATTIFGGMIFQIPIGKLSDIFPRRSVIAFISICLLVITSILGYYNGLSFLANLVLLFLFGGFAFTLYPVSITYACDFSKASSITSITAAALIMFGAGSVIGPLISSSFMLLKNPSGLFIFFSLLSLFLSIFAVYTSLSKK